MTEAAREAADLGLMEPVKGGVARGLKLRTLDYVKRAIGDMERKAMRVEGAADDARILGDLRRRLTKAIDNATGGKNSPYLAVRSEYGDEAEVLESLSLGRNALKLDPEEIAREIGPLSDAAKESYRSGFARAIKDIVDKTSDSADATRRIFGNSLIRQKIRSVFPDKSSYNAMAKPLLAEGRFAETKNAVTAGSRTTPMAQEAGWVDRLLKSFGAIMGSKIPGTHALVGAGAGRGVISDALLGPAEQQQMALANILTDKNQARTLGLLDTLSQAQGKDQASQAVRDEMLRAFIALMAQREGAAAGNQFRGQSQLP
jgi:hypothetical protein